MTSYGFTECYAVPGERSIIDEINPRTGRTVINGETFEQVRQRYPTAERMTFETWQNAQIARQQTLITWTPITERKYQDMLEVLPPIDWTAGGFLVGEPYDHCAQTGQPRYMAYREIGSHYYRRHFESSRPVTRAELRAILKGGA